MCLACGARGRRASHPRARQHPPCHHGRTHCAASFTNVCYISMMADGGERRGEKRRGGKGEGEGDEARGEGDPPHLGWRRRELYPCA